MITDNRLQLAHFLAVFNNPSKIYMYLNPDFGYEL